VLEARGDNLKASEVAAACAATPRDDDWRAASAIARCLARVDRLRSAK
jgi:hypothetical protein